MKTLLFAVAVLIAYFLGNISPAIILGKIKGIDIKKEGSGNAGTTNVLRVLGKKAALITLLVDVLKGVVAVALGMAISGYTAGTVSALAVFGGHIWPVFYKFKGGKGVATAFGAVLAINWQIALISFGVAALCVLLFRRMSVGSIMAALTFAVLVFFFERPFIYIAWVMVFIILYNHRSNIVRLLKGQEPKMNFSSKKGD